MTHTFKQDRGYMMPPNFGPMSSQRVFHYGDVTTFIIIYITDKDSLAAFLPEPFEPADEPAVTVYFQLCRDVDFMAGRGYNIVGVNLSTVFKGKKDHLAGNFAVVLWENDAHPIIQGREVLGTPKIYADIPDPRQSGNNWQFHCSLYGNRLVEGEIKNTALLKDTEKQLIEDMAKDNMWMGWKYIPKTDWSGPELSYPTAIPYKLGIDEAWLGDGFHRFAETAWESAPTSAHIIDGLRTLTVKEYRSAVIMKGTVDLLIGDSRRME
jgi:acetoacetate decarboxylase